MSSDFADYFARAPIGFHCFGSDGLIIAVNDAELAVLGDVGRTVARTLDPDVIWRRLAELRTRAAWRRRRGARRPYGGVEDRMRILDAGFQMHIAKRSILRSWWPRSRASARAPDYDGDAIP